ncbi:MAG: family transposase [Schlesneria sp.]|nr:family transposase [Schlesneria sp.]
MQDHELYQRIAGGVAPWTVGEIKVESVDQRLEVQVECNDGLPQRCPDCNDMLLVCGHGDEQTWQQPDVGPWQIFLIGRVPLVDCPEHGVVRVSPPWADWYIRGLDYSLLGPWSLQQLKLLMDAGRLSPSTLLKRGSSDKWVITGTVSALFVKQDETFEPALSADELEAVDWAIENEPIVFLPYEPSVSDDIETEDIPTEDNAARDNATIGNATGGNASAGEPRRYFEGYSTPVEGYQGNGHQRPRRDLPVNLPEETGDTPAGPGVNQGPPESEPELRLREDSDRDAGRDSPPRLKPARPAVPREPEKKPARQPPKSLQRLRKPVEPSPSEWGMVIEQAAVMEQKAKAIRKKPADEVAAEVVKTAPRREVLVRRRGFQHGFQLLTMAYLINACLVCTLFPAVCMIFFSRLLLLSTSVFAPFEGGNDLQEGQLVECGLSALILLVLVGFPVWHLFSNDGVTWHYIPSALVGVIAGFALSPDYLDEVIAAIQWCEFGFGIAAVGLTVYTLSAVPSRSRMSLPIIAAGLLTAASVMVLFSVRSGSMLSVQADAIPPQFRGGLPDAPLYIFGLYGTLVFIPVGMLFELYRHANLSTRQFINRSGVLLGIYLLAGLAAVGSFIHGAGSGFFDVPLALLPLACINALAAAIPSTLLLVDPQFSVTDD